MSPPLTLVEHLLTAPLAFDLTPDQREILDGADRYARAELYPLAVRMDEEEWWPAEAFARLGPAGYLGVAIPQAYGGGARPMAPVGRYGA